MPKTRILNPAITTKLEYQHSLLISNLANSCWQETIYCHRMGMYFSTLETHECIEPYQVVGSTGAGAATWQTTMERQQSSMCSPADRWTQKSQSGQARTRYASETRFHLWVCVFKVTHGHPPCWAWPQPARRTFWSHQDSSGLEW